MNFYKSQDQARKKTKILVFYYCLAILGVISVTYVALALLKMQFMPAYEIEGGRFVKTSAFFDLHFFLWVAGGTILVIGSGSIYKSMQLSQGGGVVAQSLGGRPVDPNTRDSGERQLLNVVEEMAIASGVPVPQVWIMDDDDGINAFAAGTTLGNAVIGVTRGTMQRLNRSELQGVIGHEFSHILNGDMLLNIRLLCMLHGLLLLSIVGQGMIRVVFYSGGSRDREGQALQLALAAVGLVITITGAVGAFFANMIQAAISRQREYLADASAVEFTMDPNGLTGALRKIGGASMRSKVSSPSASEVQHMFFSEAGLFTYGFSSHPPLEERITLIDPSWDGSFLESTTHSYREQGSVKHEAKSAPNSANMVMAGAMMDVLGDDMGNSSHTNLRKGQQVMEGIEAEWHDATHDKYQAQLLIFGMLIAGDKQLRKKQLRHLEEAVGKEMAELAKQWHKELAECHSHQCITLIDLCIPTLRRISNREYEDFINLTQWLIHSDDSVDLFEFMLQKMLQRHLDSHFYGEQKVKIKFQHMNGVASQVNTIASTMCGIGANSEEDVHLAYASISPLFEEYGCPKMELLPPDACGLDAIDAALQQLKCTTPMVKKQILHLCGKAVLFDDQITSEEAELLRAVADAMGCAVPPFVQH